MEFYNVKLKKKVDVDQKDFEVVTMKNGSKAAKAVVLSLIHLSAPTRQY